MDDLRAAAASLAGAARRPLSFTPAFHALPGAAMPARTVAVDGSAAVLVDNGAVWVVAVRAEAVAWPGPKPPEVAPRIVAVQRHEAQAHLEAAYAAAGLEAPRAAGAEPFASALQAIAEHAAALAALKTASPPDLLLMDGALRGLPRHAQGLADVLVAAAQAVGVPVVGVAKRSGMGDVLVPQLAAVGPRSVWAVAVPDEPGTFVARLHAAAPFAFRVDAASLADVARLVPLCRDAAYVGYPYLLALAHNRVALTAGRVAELQAGLDRELRRQGGAAAGLAADFHAVLDRNVTG